MCHCGTQAHFALEPAAIFTRLRHWRPLVQDSAAKKKVRTPFGIRTYSECNYRTWKNPVISMVCKPSARGSFLIIRFKTVIHITTSHRWPKTTIYSSVSSAMLKKYSERDKIFSVVMLVALREQIQ